MQQRMRMSQGAYCSVLPKKLRLSAMVSAHFPNALPTQQLEYLRVSHQSQVTRRGLSYEAVFFSSATIPGETFHCAKRFEFVRALWSRWRPLWKRGCPSSIRDPKFDCPTIYPRGHYRRWCFKCLQSGQINFPCQESGSGGWWWHGTSPLECFFGWHSYCWHTVWGTYMGVGWHWWPCCGSTESERAFLQKWLYPPKPFLNWHIPTMSPFQIFQNYSSSINVQGCEGGRYCSIGTRRSTTLFRSVAINFHLLWME